jgi:hypothetical protein
MADVDEASKELFVFTMSAKTGQIVKFESVDGAGARREISEDEWRKLAKQKTEATLEKLLEEAFEAGIACALGSEDETDEEQETAEDADLRQLLLRPLFEQSAAARLMRRAVLRQAILQSLIQLAGKARAPEPSARSVRRH